MTMLNWFTGLFTSEGLVQFCAGVIAATVYHWTKTRIMGWRMSFRWKYAAIPLTAAVVVFIAAQTQENANCVREFNQILRVRAQITEDNDHWSAVQRKALGDWLKDILNPPADMLQLRRQDPNDPRYQQWAFDTTEHYSVIIQQAQTEQDENAAERKQHPLPAPTCGLR